MTQQRTRPPAGRRRASRSTPEQIRAEIEQTQQELGDTVEALAHKTDVKAQASARIDAAKESIQETIHGARETVTESKNEFVTKVKQATPSQPAPAPST